MSELRNGQFMRSERGDTSAGNGGTWVEFFTDTILDELATQTEGRQIFKDIDRIRYYFPGNPNNRPVFAANAEEQQKWPKEYAAFKAKSEVAVDGIPIEQWPLLTKSQVLELKALGFRTVEQVAGMNDLAVQRINPGGLRLKNNAAAYLDDAAAGALLAKTTADNDRLNQRLAEQDKKLAEQGALINDLHTRLMARENAPNAVSTTIPGMIDPAEAARMGRPQEQPGTSALANMPEPRRGPGRPRKDVAA